MPSEQSDGVTYDIAMEGRSSTTMKLTQMNGVTLLLFRDTLH